MYEAIKKMMCLILISAIMSTFTLPAMAIGTQSENIVLNSLIQMYENKPDNNKIKSVYKEILEDIENDNKKVNVSDIPSIDDMPLFLSYKDVLNYVEGTLLGGLDISDKDRKKAMRLAEEIYKSDNRTDRYIVKYKSKKEDTFKEKADMLVNINKTLEISDNNMQEAFKNKTEVLFLDEKICPQKFADKIIALKGYDEIEYIQPDYKMSVSSADDGIDEKTDSYENQGENQDMEEIKEDEDSAAENTVEILQDEQPPAAIGDKIKVAVIDTGIDVLHNDLYDRIWVNAGEIAGNGIDDDANGYIDDINGWNFVSDNNALYDESLGLDQAHATHISGIIAGKSNVGAALGANSINVVIMPLKVFEGAAAYTSDIIKAIRYADKMGAKIINCSFGGAKNNPALKEAMADSGALFVCAAGNSHSDLGDDPIYPAAFELDNIVSVASVNADGGLSYFSNYGENTVDIAALGRDVQSAYPNNQTGAYSGTSQAAAFVSGGAAAVLGQNPGFSARQIKNALINGADKINSLTGKIKNSARLNIKDSVNGLNKTSIKNIAYEEDINRTFNMTNSDKTRLFSSAETIKVSAAGSITLILKSDGSVWSWGGNFYATSGVWANSFDTQGYSALNMVTGLSGVTDIAAGYNHCLALKSDGSVWAWGYNRWGQLGNDSNTDSSIPLQVYGLADVTSIASGYSHSMALKSDQTLWIWGAGWFGALGCGEGEEVSWAPMQVPGMADVISISAGEHHTHCVKSGGSVWSWGLNNEGQLGINNTDDQYFPTQVSGITGVASVCAAEDGCLVLKSDGSVWGWGANNCGQLGDGTYIDSLAPVQAGGLAGVVKLAAAADFSLALKNDGSVWGWGLNGYGSLGDATNITRNTPAQVNSITDVSGVFAGGYTGYFLKSDGSVCASGLNIHGELGLSGNTAALNAPVQVSGITQAQAASAGRKFSLLLKSDNTLLSWGQNEYGELGDATYWDDFSPGQVSDLTDVLQISSGWNHSLALKSDGTVKAWGKNNYGQLGDGTYTEKLSPVSVPGLTDITSVSCAYNHSLALKNDGTVWSWGDNSCGQLGDATYTDKNQPVQVSALTGVTKILTGEYYSLALKSDGSVWGWGCFDGDLNMDDDNVPAQVSCLFDISKIYFEAHNAVAIKTDGSVWVWGDNTYGQIGDETTTYKAEPILINTLGNVKEAAIGDGFVVVLKTDGTLYSAGRNGYGQLGHGNNRHYGEFNKISGIFDVVYVECGKNNVLAVKADGTLWSWGFNEYAKAGHNFVKNVLSPIESLTQAPPVSGQEHVLLDVAAGQIYNIDIKASNITDFAGKQFTLNYDSGDFDIDDLCALTYVKETAAGQITEANINIISISSGSVVFEAYFDVPPGKKWTGSVNVIGLKAKRTGGSTVAISIN